MTDRGSALLAIGALEISERGRRLLEPCSFTVEAGQRVLLVGPSGAGKSLFVDLLLGFAGRETPGLEVGGSMRLEGRERLDAPPDTAIGAVFQVHRPGVFDDLTVRQNLRFGSPDAAAREEAARDLGLGALDRPAGTCSGGEQVRTVLARTLLCGADIVVFDEPTAGLDAASSARVVEAIRRSHRRLTLVVTHDYAAFEQFADVVLFLDPATRTIRRVSSEDLGAVREALRRSAPPPPPAPTAREPTARRAARAAGRAAEAAADRAGDFAVSLVAPLAWPRAIDALDGPRVRMALRRYLSPGVALFVAASTALVAVTATYFLFERLPKRPYAEALFLDDLLGGLGVVLVRVVVPVLTSLLLAAKLGASAAAALGHMSLTRQIDALRLLGVSVRRHLLLPVAGGQLLAAWVHTVVALAVSFLASVMVFLWNHPGWSATYVWRAWLKEIRFPEDFLWVAAKVGVSACFVAAVAFRAGIRTKRRPEEVVEGIHETLLQGLLVVLAVHAAFAFLEFS